jgi:hypothetical protein
MVQGVRSGRVHRLFGLHGGLHHRVVGLEGIGVVAVALEDVLLDPLTQAVLGNGGDDLATVVLLGVDPPDDLVHLLQIGLSVVQVVALDHRLSDGRRVLLELGNHGRIVKDPAGDLAVPPTQPQDQVKGGFLLDVVVAEGSSVLELFAGKDQSLLVRGNSLLVLDLGLDVVDGVGGFDVEGDGLTGQSLDENLLRCVVRSDDMRCGKRNSRRTRREEEKVNE